MGFMPCKHCHKRINTEVQHAGCEKYGYCSWHCFETEDQKAGMGNFLKKKDDPTKVKVVEFLNK